MERPDEAVEVLTKLGDLEDADYGRVYIEYGGFSDSRTVLYHEGHWCYDDTKHSYYFTCLSFQEALWYMIDPPDENAWEDNIVRYHGEVNPGVTLPRGEHP